MAFGSNQTGMFELVLNYNVSAADGSKVRKQCPLLSTLEVRCGAQEQVVDGQCRSAAPRAVSG
jgi:hypothetical protein